MDSLKPVSINSLSDAEIEAIAPWVVVTAIHNDDRFNGDDVAWYAACESRFAHARLWGRSWHGGHYAACIYPCKNRNDAERLRDFLELRDLRAIRRRELIEAEAAAAEASAEEAAKWEDAFDVSEDDTRSVLVHTYERRQEEDLADRDPGSR